MMDGKTLKEKMEFFICVILYYNNKGMDVFSLESHCKLPRCNTTGFTRSLARSVVDIVQNVKTDSTLCQALEGLEKLLKVQQFKIRHAGHFAADSHLATVPVSYR